MTLILSVFINFTCMYLVIGGLLILLPAINNWLEKHTQKCCKEHPLLDEYLVRMSAYIAFILFWAFFWVAPFKKGK